MLHFLYRRDKQIELCSSGTTHLLKDVRNVYSIHAAVHRKFNAYFCNRTTGIHMHEQATSVSGDDGPQARMSKQPQ